MKNLLITLLGISAAGMGFGLWIYWSLIYPVLRESIQFRVESLWDRLRLLSLQGEIGSESKVYLQISTFLKEAREATENESWIRLIPAPKEEVQGRKIRLQSLISEMDDQHSDLRRLVAEAVHSMTQLYVAQRPFLVCLITPIAVLSLLFRRAKQSLGNKEVEYAARTMAAA